MLIHIKQIFVFLIICLVFAGFLSCKEKESLGDKKYQKGPTVVKEYHPEGTKGGPMVLVREGEFIMGSSEDQLNYAIEQCEKMPITKKYACSNYFSDEVPQHKVYLDAFYIDRYEVRVEDYRECVIVQTCKEPTYDYDEWSNWANPDHADHPVNYVSFEQAITYCEWAGKRLPTEAEWEKAARGSDDRLYPWGNDEASWVNRMGKQRCGKHSTCQGGFKALDSSLYGALDMAGNVQEYVSDWYDEKYYATSPVRNPKGPPKGVKRIVRGGHYKDAPYFLRVVNRTPFKPLPNSGHWGIGFRCAINAN